MRRFVAVALMLTPAMARAWWNEDWTARKQLRIDTSPAGAAISEPIGATAVLVRLHAGNFKFELAKEDGSDVRFVAADDKTPLPHHFEKYDALLGEALVWVGLADLKPGARTDLWLYYKNPNAARSEDVKATYDKTSLLVYHFAEKSGPPRDSTAGGHEALSAGTGTDALIGRGLRLDGTAGVGVPEMAAAKLTWSAWIKPSEAEASGVVFSRGALAVGLEKGRPYAEVGKGRAAAAAALPANGWHHLAVIAGDAIALFVDGLPAATLATPLPPGASPAAIGPTFKGELDELQIAGVERPPGFVRFAALSQGTDPGKLLVFGQDEESGNWSSGYLSIIIRSVTLDGWVVIGVLGIMAAVSWTVMASKSAYLSAVQSANDKFSERFAAMSDALPEAIDRRDAAALGDARVLRNSSLYRLFRIAADETRKRVEGRPLSAEGIESIRASLDAGLVRESQKLNAKLVLLTIAISGGPFLGLLGTVVGVMITFASIAAAGDVNVNAIAPGIAAALVATVAGLGVAIPALFGYNWLLARVKNVSAIQQVFVDELITRIAEAYSDGARPARLVAAERAS